MSESAKRQLSVRNVDVLMNVESPHKWRSTLTSAVFGLSSSLPPIFGRSGGLVCESVGQVDLLSDHFGGMQSRESLDLPLTCHPSPRLTTVDLDPYGGSDPLGMFPLFLKRTADVLVPRLSVVFRRPVRLGSFPVCW